MDDPRRRVPWRVAPIVAGAFLATMLAASLVGPVAADDPGADPLAGPFVDVALVSPSGNDGPSEVFPRALAVRATEPGDPGTVRVDLLEAQGAGWRLVNEAQVATGLSAPGPSRLVALDGSYALVATDLQAGRTSVSLLDPAGPLIRAGRELSTISGVGVGPADVDGDGTHELILTSDLVVARSGECPGTRLMVLDGRSLAIRDSFDMLGVGLDGAAVGRFGPTRSERIVGYARPDCQSGDAGSRGAFVIDPGSGGHRSIGAGPIGALGRDGGTLVPLVADLDRDGIDEPIMRDDTSTLVLDPAHGWRAETILRASIPLAIVDARDRPRLVVERTPGDTAPTIDLISIGRMRPGAEVSSQRLASLRLDPGATAAPDLLAGRASSLPVWVGDVDGLGCSVVLVPGATIRRCPGDTEAWTAGSGPAWLQTVPLAAYGGSDSRHLLVAGGVDWAPPKGGLATPWPEAVASRQTGGWRSITSRRFTLQVVDAAGLSGAGRGGSLSVGIAETPTAGGLPEVAIASLPGDRLFVRRSPSSSDDPAPPIDASDEDPFGYLLQPTSDGLDRGAVVAPSTSGSPGRAISVSIPLPVGSRAWLVDVLTLDGYGRPSAVAHARVVQDTTGPTVVVDPPVLSVPWPFSTRIVGTAEPGARIRLGSGPFTKVGTDGTFAFEPQLAPWPQDLEFEAVDRAGNPSWRTISAVGGFDYRDLPFQALVIVAVLLGAAATTFGLPSVRRRRGAMGGPMDAPMADPWQRPRGSIEVHSGPTSHRASADSVEYGEIEDLPPGGRTRGP